MRMVKWIQCMNGKWKVYPWNIHKMDIRRKKWTDLSSPEEHLQFKQHVNSLKVLLFVSWGLGRNIVVAEFRGDLDKWWSCAALSPSVEPRGKCPRNWASKDICKKISHRSQSHCSETWAPPFLRQNCVKPRPLLKSCTSVIAVMGESASFWKCHKIPVKQMNSSGFGHQIRILPMNQFNCFSFTNVQ